MRELNEKKLAMWEPCGRGAFQAQIQRPKASLTYLSSKKTLRLGYRAWGKSSKK